MSESPAIAVSCRLAPARPMVWWVLVLVALLAAGVYANSLHNSFAFDDLAIVQNNPHVVDLQWTTIWTDNYWPTTNGVQPDTLYRPLTLWSYLANQALAPGNAALFHGVNVVLHALVTVLVALLAWRLVGNRTVALVAGMLFAVHPLHTEVVANTVGRAELLAGLWSLLTLLIFLPPQPLIAEASAPAPRRWWHGILVAVCFLAAMLSKETPATLVFALPLIDAWRWYGWSRNLRPAWWRWAARQTLRYYLPLGAAFAGYLAVRAHFCGLMSDTRVIAPIVNPLVSATLPERIVTPFTLLAKYLILTLWPVHLSADYSAPSLLPTANPFFSGHVHLLEIPFQPPAILGMLVCVLTLLACALQRRKNPQIMLLVGLFFLSYFLVSNVIRIGTIFGERLFYWPSVFVLTMIAWAAVAAFQAAAARISRSGPRAAFYAAGLVLLAIPLGLLSLRTWIRNPDWAGNLALAISTARDNPDSGKACSWAGANLIVAADPDCVAFGKSLIERAIELSPDFVSARWELAKYYGLHDQLGESAVCLAQAVRLDPGSQLTRTAIPALLKDLKRDQNLTYLPAILGYWKEHPDEDAANLAMAFAFHAQGDLDQAECFARNAVDLARNTRPGGFEQFHEAGAELASIVFDRGMRDSNRADIDQALHEFRIYVTYMHNSTEARLAFASMLLSLDPQRFPGALDEAQYNVVRARALTANDSHVRELQGRINGLYHNLARKAGVTASALPDGKPDPILPAGVGP